MFNRKKYKRIKNIGRAASIFLLCFFMISSLVYIPSSPVSKVDMVSAAANGTGMYVYDEDGANNTTPHYRTWSESDLSAEGQAQDDESASDDTNHTIIEASPARDEYMMGRLEVNGHLDVQLFSGGSWINGSNAPTNGNFTTGIGTTNDIYRGFDIAYENLTGDGMVLYDSSTSGDGLLKYRTWNGSAWSAEASLDYTAVDEATPDVAYWVECEADFGSDNILCAWQEKTQNGVYAAVWDGDSWESISQLTAVGQAGVYQNFDVAWEGTSGQGMVVFGLEASAWLDASTYTEGVGFADTSSITGPASATNSWFKIAGSPNNDYIAMTYVEDVSATSSDMGVDMWNGSNWTSVSVPAEDPDVNGTSIIAASPQGDVAWEQGGGDRALFVWKDGSISETAFRYMFYDISANQWQAIEDGTQCTNTEGGAGSIEVVTDMALAEDAGGPCTATLAVEDIAMGFDLNSDPASNKIMVLAQDATADLKPELFLYNGDTNATWTQTATMAAPELDLSTGATMSATVISKPYDFAFKAYDPPDRYWVGGSGTWDGTTTHWSFTSGGSAGAPSPTANNNVIFNASSCAGNCGTTTVTTSGTTTDVAKSINFTGFTGTFSHAAGTEVNIGYLTSGNLTFVSGMTYTIGSATTSVLDFVSSATGNTITTGGKTLPTLTFNTAEGTWAFADNATISGTVTIGTNGSLATGANLITFTNTGTPLTVSGTFTATSGGTVLYTGNGATVASTTYHHLRLEPSSSSQQVLGAGSLVVNGNLTIGDGTSGHNGATAATNNPTIAVTGTTTIKQYATFTTGNAPGTIKNTYNSQSNTVHSYTWDVPALVTSIVAKAWGGGGGGSADAVGGGSPGGAGGFAGATISVTPGETLNIYVGGRASGSTTTSLGRGGGGYSAITRGTILSDLSNILILAGGGGGGGSKGATGAGGAGGGTSGVVGSDGSGATGGGAGTQLAGGAGGTGNLAGEAGSAIDGGDGSNSTDGVGGGGGGSGGANGGGTGGTHTAGAGGGGGAGYYGGGGGANSSGGGGTGGGGGGGSSFVGCAGCTSTTNTAGSGTTPGNTGDTDYTGTYGNGGAARLSGVAGYVVVAYVSNVSAVLTGAVTVEGTLSGSGTGEIQMNGGLTVSSTGSINLTGGTITLAGGTSMTNSGSAIFNNIAASAGSGVTIVQNSTTADITINGLLTVANGGVTLTKNNTAGTSVISVVGGVAGTGNLILDNDSSLAAGVSIATASVNNIGTVTNSGSGAGTAQIGITSVIGTNVTEVIQNSTTSILVLAAANTFSGSGLSIKAGSVLVVAQASAVGAGNITLGNTTGTAAASLLIASSSLNITRPVILATNATAGTLTLGTFGSITGTTFSGGVTGTNNLTINDGAGSVAFTTAAINITGTVTNIGAGSGTTISSTVDATNIVQNSSTSSLTLSGTTTLTGDLTISSGTLVAPAGTLTIGGNFTDAGTFTHSSGTVVFNGAGVSQIDGNSTIFHNFSVTTDNKSIKFKQGETVRFNGLLTLNPATDGQNILLNSIDGSGQWTINHQGTEDVDYVTVNHSTCHVSSTPITTTNSTDGGTNVGTCWEYAAAGITISGTCDAFDQTTDCTDDGSNAIKVAINGVVAGQTDTTVDGSWSISGVTTPSSGASVIVFVNGSASGDVADSNEAVAVTLYDGTGDIGGMVLYKEHLTIGSNDTPAVVTNAHLDDYDQTSDEDVFYESNASSFTCDGVASTTGLCVDGTGQSTQEELYVKTGWTFTPGGNVSSSAYEVVGTLSAGSNTITATGTGTPFVVSGAFTTGSSTVKYTGTTANVTATTYNNLTLGGTGTYTMPGTSIVVSGDTTIASGATATTGVGAWTQTGNLVVTGTLSGTANGTITASGDVEGTGTINLTSAGTFIQRVGAMKEFGPTGSNDWNFVNLTFSNSDSSLHNITTETTGSGNVAVTGTLTIGQGGDTGETRLNPGDITWTLSSSGTPLVFNASSTICPFDICNENTSTFNYTYTTGGGSITITPAGYYNLGVGTTSDTNAASTFTLGGAITATNLVTIGNTGSTNNDVLNTGTNYALTFGSLTITSKGTLTANDSTITIVGSDVASTFTNNGIFNRDTSTVVVDHGTVNGIPVEIISFDGNIDFYDFYSDATNKRIKFDQGSTYAFRHDLTLNGTSNNGSIILDSINGTDQWFINLYEAATIDISYIVVRNSGCDIASDNIPKSVTIANGGNNGSCWDFITKSVIPPGEENTSGGGTPRTGGGRGGSGGGDDSGGGAGTLPQAFGCGDVALSSCDSNWTLLGSSVFTLSSGKVYSNLTTANTMAQWTAGSFNVNQYAEITLSTLSGAGYIGVAVRTQTGAHSGYGAYANNQDVKIVEWSGGSVTSTHYTGSAYSPGDILRLEISGTTLTLKKNGTTVTTVSDEATYSSGRPGLAGYGNTSNTNGDSWYAGSLASQGGGGGGGGEAP